MDIAIVTKVPKLKQLSVEDKAKLPGYRIAEMKDSANQLRKTLEQLGRLMATLGHRPAVIRIDELPESLDEYDLVIPVGGDGTILAISHLIKDTLVLPILGDKGSVGSFFPYRDSEKIEKRLRKITEHGIEKYLPRYKFHRLEIQKNAEFVTSFLNDVLFTNAHAAAMSVYQLYDCTMPAVNDMNHYSSGLWISTAAGSTGGIHSAGVTPVNPYEEALLWKVREAYEGKERCWQKEGGQTGIIQGLNLIPLRPNMVAYVDGDHLAIETQPGDVLQIRKHAHSLRIV